MHSANFYLNRPFKKVSITIEICVAAHPVCISMSVKMFLLSTHSYQCSGPQLTFQEYKIWLSTAKTVDTPMVLQIC